MSKLHLFSVIIIVLVIATVSIQSAQQPSAIEEEIKKLDQAEANAVLSGELNALDKLWSKDFIVNTPLNTIGNGDAIRKGVVTYSSFIRKTESIKIHGNTVIAMGQETVVPKGNAPDAGKTINRRYTHLWMKNNGNWSLTARHANVICAK